MEENKISASSNQKKPIVWIILTVIFAVVAVGVLFWLFSIQNNLNVLLEEKELQRADLEQQLNVLIIEHELVKEEYGELSDSLVIKDSIIQANAVEIQQLLNTKWEYYKVKKKLEQLQGIAQGYVHQMDSLYRVNDALEEENVAIKKDLKQVTKEKEVLEEVEKELTIKVEMAATLQAHNIIASGIRLRSGGKKEVPTDKTRKMEKIKVCFILGANEIAEAGKRDVYVRIARPDQEILTRTRGDDLTFGCEGEMIQYSIKRTVNYENTEQDLCVYWSKQYSNQDMHVGLYNVDLFCDGEEIGHTTFTLK